jgi:hypothetical protein
MLYETYSLTHVILLLERGGALEPLNPLKIRSFINKNSARFGVMTAAFMSQESYGISCHINWKIVTDVSQELGAPSPGIQEVSRLNSTTPKMEAFRSSKTSENI